MSSMTSSYCRSLISLLTGSSSSSSKGKYELIRPGARIGERIEHGPSPPWLSRWSSGTLFASHGRLLALSCFKPWHVSRCPLRERGQQAAEFFAGGGQAIHHLRRHLWKHFSPHQSVRFQLAKLLGEHLLRHPRHLPAQLCKPLRPVPQ